MSKGSNGPMKTKTASSMPTEASIKEAKKQKDSRVRESGPAKTMGNG